MINFNLILNNKFLLIAIIITFIISLYNLLKHVNNDKYESYIQMLFNNMPYKNLSDITPDEFNTYVQQIPSNTAYISYDVEFSISSKSTDILKIEDDKGTVSNSDPNDFYLDFKLYYSNSKKKSTFKSKSIKKIKTNLNKLKATEINNFQFTIDNINFKYYFVGVNLININKNYKITTFSPNVVLFNTVLNKK